MKGVLQLLCSMTTNEIHYWFFYGMGKFLFPALPPETLG